MNEKSYRDNSCHWVGVDVAKDSFDAALVFSGQHYGDALLSDVPVASFKRTRDGVEAFLRWLDGGIGGQVARVVMEATGRYSQELAVWMLELRLSLFPAIVNPRQTAHFIKSLGLRSKTDRLDARALGFYGIERRPVAYDVPTPERAQLRELSRYRSDLVQQCTRLKNQMQENYESDYITREHKKHLERFKKDITRVEKAMEKLVGKHDEFKRDVGLLKSIYGIGFTSAVLVLAELGDLRRFELARQLTAFAGMSPRHHQSGTSVHGRSRLCKQGNPRVRQILYLAAMTAVRGKNQFRDTYQRLIAEGKKRMVALGAIMRKLLVLMRAILISGKPYNPVGITRL